MLLKKLVLAEDDDDIAHLISATLGDSGFLCYRARDGEEALTLCRRETPDLLVLDIMMPCLDGIEVAKRLKADVIASRIPILMLTALGAVDDKVKGLDAGADDYLAKPFDLRELSARVRSLIRSSRRERDRNATTNLPGAFSAEERVESMLSNKEDRAVMYIDTSHFEAYVDALGCRRADEMIADVSGLVLAHARARAGDSAFVAHLGGDDFVVVIESALAKDLADELITAFDQKVASYYDEAPDADALPRMTLSIAIIDAQNEDFETSDDLATHMARAKRESKKQDKSNVVVWAGKYMNKKLGKKIDK